MPLDPRFLHWLQAADEKLFYTVGEVRIEVEDAETVDEEPPESYDAWEERARMIAAANAALRAQEERAWP